MLGIGHINVRTRLWLGFGIALLAMFLLAGLFWHTLSGMKTRLDEIVERDFLQVQLANTTRDAIRDQSIALRDITLQEDVSLIKSEMKRFRDARTRLNDSLESLEAVSLGAFSRQITRIRENAEHSMSIIDAVREAALSDDSEGREKARTLVRDDLRPLQTAQISALEEILSQLEVHSKAAAADAKTSQNRVILLSAILTALALMLCITLSLLITRSITSPLNMANLVCRRIADKDLSPTALETRSDELGQLLASLEAMRINLLGALQQVRHSASVVTRSIHDIHQGASILASHADEQDQSADSISQTVTNLSSTLSTIAQSTRNMDEQAKQSQHLAQQGATEIEAERAASRQLITTVNQTCANVQDLSEAVREIGIASSTIKEIADQTNLLALNAAIEAARAGESGRGFAVVADEVRKLAEKTGDSTASITRSIEKVSTQVSQSLKAMQTMQQEVIATDERAQSAERSLGQIVVSSDHLQALAGEIAQAINEQEAMSRNAVAHTNGIQSLSRESAEKLHQIDEQLQQLAHTTEELDHLVRAFRIE